jgi:hypothetical protein
VADLEGFTDVLAALLSTGGPGAPLGICQACVAWLPMSGAAVTVMASADRQELVCASDTVAARIDELQFSLGEGPCVEAFMTGRTVQIADIVEVRDSRWPMFAAAARDTPARGMYVFPLHVGAGRLGVLDCYRDTPGPLTADELAGALRAADAAVWALLDQAPRRNPTGNDPTPAGVGATPTVADDHGDRPDQAWSGYGWSGVVSPMGYPEIHQATGMIIGQVGGTAASALARLRAAAFAAERPIDEVARDVVGRRLRFDERDGP